MSSSYVSRLPYKVLPPGDPSAYVKKQILGVRGSHFTSPREARSFYNSRGYYPPRYTSTVPDENGVSYVYNDGSPDVSAHTFLYNSAQNGRNYTQEELASIKRNPATTSSDVDYTPPAPSAPLPERNNYSQPDITYAKQYGTTPPAGDVNFTNSADDVDFSKLSAALNASGSSEEPSLTDDVVDSDSEVPKGWDKGDWLRLGLTLLGAGLGGASTLFGKDGPFSGSASSPFGRSSIVPQIPLKLSADVQNQLLPYLQAFSQRIATPFTSRSSSSSRSNRS